MQLTDFLLAAISDDKRVQTLPMLLTLKSSSRSFLVMRIQSLMTHSSFLSDPFSGETPITNATLPTAASKAQFLKVIMQKKNDVSFSGESLFFQFKFLFSYILLLVFSKCFRAGFGTFSTLKYRVKGSTNSRKLCVLLKLQTYLIFISAEWGCVTFCVSVLTERRLKGLR